MNQEKLKDAVEKCECKDSHFAVVTLRPSSIETILPDNCWFPFRADALAALRSEQKAMLTRNAVSRKQMRR